MMKISYLVDINLSGDSGKEKGSKEKADSLKGKIKHVKIWSLGKYRNRSFVKLLAMFFLELRYLIYNIFNKSRPDVIFTRSIFAFGTWAVGKFFKIPVIREVHADLWDEYQLLFAGKKHILNFLKYIYGYNLFFIKQSDGLIFNNSQLQEHYVKKFNLDLNKTITVPNGCDIKRFYPIPKAEARAQLSLDSQRKYLLFIGSVSKWHGVEYLLDMQLELSKLDPTVTLLIVGNHDLSELETLKKTYHIPNIEFVGKVVYRQALFYINAADVCLIPVNNIRISPGSPIKLYDSIACGKPIITQSNTPGYSDITTQYGLGINTDFTDITKSAQQTLDFLSASDFYYYSTHNRKIAEEVLSWDKMMDKWLEFAESIIRIKHIDDSDKTNTCAPRAYDHGLNTKTNP